VPRLGISFYVLVGVAVAVIAGAVLGLFRLFVVAVAVLVASIAFPLAERFWVWRITRAVRAERRRLEVRPDGHGDREVD
jgi:hypothetical protein